MNNSETLISNDLTNTEPIVKKKYDSSKYNKTFMEKNNEKIYKKQVCPICYGSYTYFNKSKHLKSKRHIILTEKNVELKKTDLVV